MATDDYLQQRADKELFKTALRKDSKRLAILGDAL